ncbi:hypothetical protein CSV63_07245 [Sporosarcina sp. P34]|uniref:hypothetical protein n=1 Tax=Sporosarcina sp. P34 TaxID=2048247 RepID=UPI000C16D4EB|nr:hypothetical protein [Sporosarcina sp. P34]PID15569.1 hypothetical protein CSV63_07245 [Sporosarcina sp. P34]
MSNFTVTIKAGSPAEREQRVQDLLDKGYYVVKYIEDEKHGKVYDGVGNRYSNAKVKFSGTASSKIYAAIMRKR